MPAGLAALSASAVQSLNGDAMELVKVVRVVKDVKVVKDQETGIPGAKVVPAPFPEVYLVSSRAVMGQPIARAVGASADHLNGVVTAIGRPLTARRHPVSLVIALAPIASPTSGVLVAALKVVPRDAVPTQVVLMSVALKRAVELMGGVLMEGVVLRPAGSLQNL